MYRVIEKVLKLDSVFKSVVQQRDGIYLKLYSGVRVLLDNLMEALLGAVGQLERQLNTPRQAATQ